MCIGKMGKNRIFCLPVVFCDPKIILCQNAFLAGALAWTLWGSSRRSPRLLVGWGGETPPHPTGPPHSASSALRSSCPPSAQAWCPSAALGLAIRSCQSLLNWAFIQLLLIICITSWNNEPTAVNASWVLQKIHNFKNWSMTFSFTGKRRCRPLHRFLQTARAHWMFLAEINLSLTIYSHHKNIKESS